MHKRIVFGLIAAILAQILFSYLFSLLPVNALIQLTSVSFLGAAIGSYVAKRDFLLPAITLWFISWFFTLYILLRVSNGQTNTYALLAFNWLAIIVSLLAAILGCIAVNIYIRKNHAAIN